MADEHRPIAPTDGYQVCDICHKEAVNVADALYLCARHTPTEENL